MDNRIFIRKMGHHFLFQEGSWNASGFYRDGEGNTVQLSGMTTIEHQDDLWVNEGFMEIEGDTPVRIRNRYEIIPFERGSDSTTWRSENPSLGPLAGSFAVVGDSILSAFRSPDGLYYGTEYLKSINPDTYANRGVLMTRGKIISSWSATLTRA